MSEGTTSLSYYIGWDVGGWNCDRNSKSRDAIVILDANLSLVGKPWRDNLRNHINSSDTTTAWLTALFGRCGAKYPEGRVQVTMGIDTPLGFSLPFINLITNLTATMPIGSSETNPYLFRQTELHLFRKGLRTLSSIKDMIGSQATKGMHVLARFAPQVERCGVWTDGAGFRAIETYPSACREAGRVVALRRGMSLAHADMDDALTCAIVAYLFANEEHLLEAPADSVPTREGWIWAPAGT